jgi:hypothetical protein
MTEDRCGGQLAEIQKSRDKLFFLTLTVVVFVSALGCLTLAELWRKKNRRLALMFVLGILIAAGGVFATIVIDIGSAGMFFWSTLAFMSLGYFGSKLAPAMAKAAQKISVGFGFLQAKEVEDEVEEEDPHPGEVEPLLFSGVRMHVIRARHALSIQVILLIVLTVLLSAVLGCAYSGANLEANRTSSRAADSLVEGFKTSHSGSSHYVLGSFATIQEQNVAYEAVFCVPSLLPGHTGCLLLQERGRFDQPLQATVRGSSVARAGGFGFKG